MRHHINRKKQVNKLLISKYPLMDLITDDMLMLKFQIDTGITEGYILEQKAQEYKQKHKTIKDRLEYNLNYDLKNSKEYDRYIRPNYQIYKRQHQKKQPQDYKHINKRFVYYDISIFQILKVLYKKHKISRFLYKKSIKALKQPDKYDIPNKVKRHINMYYKTFKSSTSKTTMKAREQAKDTRKRININGYSVVLKKRTQERLNNLTVKWHIFTGCDKTNFRLYRIKKIYKEIEQEFNKKLKYDNSFKYEIVVST